NPPVTDADKTITLPEDSQPIPLNINPPTDIDGDTLTVSITQLPDNSKGKITLGNGTVINVGDEISINSLTSLLYTPLADVNGNGGDFIYTVSDGKGASDSQKISFVLIAVSDNSILLREDNIFSKQYQQTISVPVDSSFLSFTYNDLNFDTTDPDSINDAFEVALVDAQGNSLIHTIQPNRDAFFNITENQPSAVASGVSIAGMTVKVNLTGVTPGDATLIFRLVNNDSDTQTSVRIRDIQLLAGDGTTAPPVTPNLKAAAINQIIDFSQLSDISSSLNAEYLRTSFNEDSKTLYADFVMRNQGEYVVDSPLVVAIKSISDPTVQVVGANGITPEGLPYYNLSNLVTSNTLDPNEITQSKTLAFLNPQEVQFTYKLVFLGKLNTEPNFISDPDIEALINKPYIYDADATDLEGDTLTYSLLTAPNGMTIESDTGKISWTPGTNTVGNYSISVQVNDGRGGIDQQDYTLSVIAPPPNRPPIITSIPIVDARVKQEYQYQAIATDPDSDTLTYSLVNAPNGMTIDANTGLIRWTATANQTGLQEVELEVNDEKGGVAEQKYQILVQQEARNTPPVIITDPVTKVYPISSSGNPQLFDLSKWTSVQYDLTVQDPDASWQIQPGNTVVEQKINADASILLSNVDVTNNRIEGTWRVGTSDDDDYIGFVFGYQDPQHFYVFDWKQADQNESSLGFAERGMSIKVVDANSSLTGTDLWPTNGNGQRVKQLFHNTVAWKDLTDYKFTIDFVPGQFTITVKEGNTIIDSVTINDNTYTSGKFGFYNYSQSNVLYSGFSQQALQAYNYLYDVNAIDPDQDKLTYSLIDKPTGMVINPDSGLITWATFSQSNPINVEVKVEDGRGGFDTQSFIIELADRNIDLTLADIHTEDLVIDGQLLTVSGQVSAQIKNQGLNNLSDLFKVVFFEDRNINQVYDVGIDTVLGEAKVNTPLQAGQSTTVTTNLSGFLSFINSPIWGFVDADKVITETNENNNLAFSSQDCLVQPSGQFNPVVEWNKNTFSVLPSSNQVMMTPAVIDLNGDKIPDIVFSTFTGSNYTTDGKLRAISGANGSELWTVTNSAYEVRGASGVAVGDIDNDGKPEILATAESGDALIAFEHDGTFKWRSPAIWGGINWGSASIADLNQDSTPEIIIGATVLDNQGRIIWQGNSVGGLGRGDNGPGPLSVVADLDLDGSPEVIAGRSAYRANGSLYWNASISDGFPAIGNFDSDPNPEIVVVSNGQVFLLEHTGQVKWGGISIPGGGRGGAPTIADVDGDGQPEIGVAGANRYVVLETDGSIKWTSVTQDNSSNVTGSSVFDFNGDGNAEIVYGDELYLRIYNGSDGKTLYQLPKGSGTTYELPLIVDVDADGNAEIVAVANNYAVGSQTGIFVIGDLNDTWVSTRQIWNQHSYHITNINDDGSIPIKEQNSWQTHNTYRLNLQTNYSPLAAPDLTASYLRTEEVAGKTTIKARIGNGGSIFVASGVNVAFYKGDPKAGGVLLGTTKTTKKLEIGGFEDVNLTVDGTSLQNIWVVADDDGTGKGQVNECDEENNRYSEVFVNGRGEIRGNKWEDVNGDGVYNKTGKIIIAHDVNTLATNNVGEQERLFAANVSEWLIGKKSGRILAIEANAIDGERDYAPTLEDAIISAGFSLTVTQNINFTLEQLQSFDAVFVGQTFPNINFLNNQILIQYVKSGGNVYLYGGVGGAGASVEASGWSAFLNAFGFTFVSEYNGISSTIIDNSHPIFQGITNLRSGNGQSIIDLEPSNSDNQIILTTNGQGTYASFSTPPDSGLAGVTVYLDLNNNGLLDPNEPTQLTAADNPNTLEIDETGQYRLTNLTPGNYIVREVVPEGYKQTSPNNPSFHTVTLTSGQIVEKINFGNTKTNEIKPNQSPSFVSTAPTTAQIDQLLRYDAKATDPDSDPLTFDLPLKPEGMAVEATTGILVWKPTLAQIGIHDVTLRVQDNKGGVSLQSFQVIVNNLNNAPIITSNPDLDTVINLPYQYHIQAQDADGDAIAFRLDTAPTGVTLDATTGILRWTPINSQVGQHTFTLIASDGKGGETRQTYNLSVLAFAPNNAPEITSTPRNSVALGTSYFYTLNISDPDGDLLTINLQTAPTGMTLNQQGLITWTPEANQLGNHTVKVEVNDGRGGFAEQEWAIAVVSQRSNNQAPQILSTPSLKANINQVYQYNLVGNDPDGDPIFWSLETRPQGMSLDVTKGTIRWQPKLDQIGLHEVVIQAIDTQGAISSQRFTLAVNGVNLPPNITSVPLTRTVTNQAYTYTVVAKDPENGILTYNLGRKPNGMTIDQTGKIQWTPTQIGNYDIDVLVADNQGATATQTYRLVVGTQAINQAPNITSTPLFVANVGSAYQYQIQASDPEGQSLTYQLIESPQGMTINPNTGLVQWDTPITGNYKVVVAAFDSQGLGVTQGYTLAAKVNSLPVIRSTTPPTGAIPGVAYRYDIQATDPDGGILTYSLDPASQAKGIILDESGRLSWTPSTPQTGIHAITLTITDAAGGKVTQSFNLTVAPDTTAPKVIINRNKNFTNKGEAVSFQVSATDNVGIANLQLLINNTPVVIDSNGVATFTPTNPGVITAKAFAFDAAGNKAEATTTVNVLDPTDTEAPSVSLDLSGIANFEITAPTPIKGTVNDTNLAYYALEVAPADGSAPFKEMFRGTTPVTNGVLGVLDPTLLPNDTYQVRLVAYDVNGKGNGVAELLDVSGDLKLGNFQLSFTDLEIPVGGIPITLTRTYDTLNSNNKDDFGFGWRMEFRDADVRTSLPKDELYQELGFRSVGFKEGDAVYITLPGGKRERFTFKLEPMKVMGIPLTALMGNRALFIPTFVADKGSTSTLSVETAGVVLTRGQNGQVVPFSGGSAFAHYHPQDWGNYYQLTTKEGIVYDIDATTGDINSITNRNSDKLTFTDAGITSSNGLKVTFGRDTQGRITTVTDPMGKQIKYEYDNKGDLIKATDRENNTTQFKYNNAQPHYLDEIIDPLGRTGVKNEYDQNGRLTKVFNGEGKTVQLDYNPDNSLYTVKDPLGNATTYEYDLRGNIVSEINANGGIIKRTYDDRNNLLSETNPEGEKLSYTYDSKGNKLSETDALGNVTRYNYNSNNDLLTTTDALGNVVTNSYDSRGNLLSITGLSNGTVTLNYNNNGLLTQLTTAEGTTKYEYDLRGNITKEINPLGQETTYTYDGNGNRLTETRQVTTTNGIRTLVTKTEYDSKGNIIKVTDAEGNISQTIYDAAGQKIKEIDALGRVTKYVYSEGGQLLETIYPDATPNNDSDNPRTRKEYDAANRVTADIDELGRPTQYQYDALGRLIYTIYPDLTPNDNTDNPRKETRYDKAGRVIAEVDERGNITRYTYDDAGRRTETILPDSTPNDDTDNPRILVTYDALGRQISQTDPLGRKTQFVYDNLGRPTGQIFADNTNISTTFDQAGRVIAKIDQEGNKTKYEYNALGQLTAVIDALNNRTEYGYNELGNLITQKDAKANITKYEYDGIGRRIVTQLPLNQHSTTQYDAVGNIISTTDFNGQIITFIYDERNRLIRKALPNNEQVVYTYTLTGQRATETDSNGTITYQYDSRDRLLSRLDPDGVKIEYTYDAAGNRTSVNIPSGKTSYTFDEQNRLKTVTDPNNGVTTYTYDLAGNLSKTTLPNGTIETREYDLLNRLLYLQNSNSNGVINSFRYTLDKVGNRLAVVEQDGRKVNYEYDDIYRLLEEEVIDGTTRRISYTYDPVSNRLTRNDSVEGNTTYEYDRNDRLLKEVTNGVTTTYTYDNNGNTLSKTTGTDKVNYQWNAENRLIGLDNNGDGVNDVTNKYDSDGIRISQKVNGDETRFLVDKNRDYAQVLEEYTPSKIIKASYVYGHDLISQLRNSQRSFYHVDGLGSTRALTDINGLVSDRYAYEAFGEIIKQLGNTKNLYLFAGEQRDPNLGLDYLRARYLDVSTGQFISRDSFAGIKTVPVSLNKYIYGHASPVINIDPSGNFTIVGLNLGGFFSTSASFLGGNLARITVNNLAGKTFERFVIAQLQRQFGKDAVFTGVRFTGPGGIRVADAVIKLGDRLIIIETKTKIPLGGSSLARLGGQIKTFSLGTPSNQALRGLAQEVVVITEQSAAAAEASFVAIEAKLATGSLSGVLQGSLELTSVLRTLFIGL
nr:tandem-95 repeat protein [Microcystis aeruginosa F13-15]